MTEPTTRGAWASSPLPAVIVPAAVGADLAAEIRTRLEHAHYTRYGLLDRGSYDFLDAPPVPDVLEILTGVAAEVTGRSLSVVSARAIRLLAGDYVLVRHDRVHDDRPVEVVLDLSPAPVAGAEVHWRHRGQVFFTMGGPEAAVGTGALALVERGPTVMSNHTYVTKRSPDASVVRLIALLR